MDLKLQAALQEVRKLAADADPKQVAASAGALFIEALRVSGASENKLRFLETEIDYTLNWESMLQPHQNYKPLDQPKAG